MVSEELPTSICQAISGGFLLANEFNSFHTFSGKKIKNEFKNTDTVSLMLSI